MEIWPARAKSAPLVQFGTASRLNREGSFSVHLYSTSPPGSRTLVTKLPDCQRYRFFSALPSDFIDAPLPSQSHPVVASPRQTVRLGNYPAWLFTRSSRGHRGHAAKGSRSRMLLSLCGIAPPRRLRKDVRFEAVRFALVGKNVRKTAYANAGQQFECGSEVSASGPCGTCETLTAVPSC
jgi:hypothetical protein